MGERTKKIVLAMSARGLRPGDLRLIITPLRYKVEVFGTVAKGRVRMDTWLPLQTMKRTRGKWIDWEYDCAVRMFERRVRDKIEFEEGHLWRTEDGRMLKLKEMHIDHLQNCLAMCERQAWRARYIPRLKEEIARRNTSRNVGKALALGLAYGVAKYGRPNHAKT